ncbi:MAG: hypothetical protein R2854_13575 [Caldilineaceae bacterium]
MSGHAWPVWHYYAPDLPVVRLPAIDVLDVDAVLDFADTAGPLRAALDPLSDRPGAWLVGWQDDVVDPMHVVPAQLELAGREKGMDSRYWGTGSALLLPAQDQPDSRCAAHRGAAGRGLRRDAVRLVGYNSLDNGDLLLFLAIATRRRGRRSLRGGDHAGCGRQHGGCAKPPRWLAGYVYPTSLVARPHRRNLSGCDRWLGPQPQAGATRVPVAGERSRTAAASTAPGRWDGYAGRRAGWDVVID